MLENGIGPQSVRKVIQKDKPKLQEDKPEVPEPEHGSMLDRPDADVELLLELEKRAQRQGVGAGEARAQAVDEIGWARAARARAALRVPRTG